MRKRVAGGIALVGALALGCSACGGTNDAASHQTQHTTTTSKSKSTKTKTAKKKRSRSSATTTTTTTTAPSPTTTTTTAPAIAACTFSELSVTLGQFGAGLGHEGGAILFENTGTTECTLTGYPGVAGLNSSGQQATQAERTRDGYLGGFRTTSAPLPVVDLAPGQTASAFVEGTDVPHGTQTSCPSYTALLVTPPTSVTSVKLTKGLPGCTPIQVHPVVAGSTGDAT